MLLTAENGRIHLRVDTLGAQMMSIQTEDGTEYLWQGDSRYWPDRAPLLFPFIARLTDDSYYYKGKLFHMGIHGFAAQSEFSPVVTERNRLILELNSSELTLRQYPFEFCLRVMFFLENDSVRISCHVENLSREVMPFGIGGHPGFRVPLEKGESFEDYRLEFSEKCQPDRVGFTPQLYLSGHDAVYPLEEGKILPLKHGLFDDDAVVLKNMAREVTLSSSVSGRSVKLSYPGMPYLGIWHAPKTNAPYVCIEPWSSLPSRQDVIEELSCKSDLVQLPPGRSYDTSWTIEIS